MKFLGILLLLYSSLSFGSLVVTAPPRLPFAEVSIEYHLLPKAAYSFLLSATATNTMSEGSPSFEFRSIHLSRGYTVIGFGIYTYEFIENQNVLPILLDPGQPISVELGLISPIFSAPVGSTISLEVSAFFGGSDVHSVGSFDNIEVQIVPLPQSFFLMAVSLIALTRFSSKRSKRS